MENNGLQANTPSYQQQTCEQTVEEALQDYFRQIDGVLDPSALDAAAKELFERHDAAHVVFGCNTSLRDEVLIDTWTLFGTDVGLAGYLAYLRVPEARQVIGDIGVWRSVRELLRSLPEVVEVARRARRMRRKWPWRDHAAFMKRPLREIREELGIEVMAPVKPALVASGSAPC